MFLRVMVSSELTSYEHVVHVFVIFFLYYSCSLNCKDKAAISAKLALMASCESFQSEKDIRYVWKVWENVNESFQFMERSTEVNGNFYYDCLIFLSKHKEVHGSVIESTFPNFCYR